MVTFNSLNNKPDANHTPLSITAGNTIKNTITLFNGLKVVDIVQGANPINWWTCYKVT